MYAWLWHHLPGSARVRSLELLLAAVLVVALLFLVVFPWVDGLLTLNQVTVDTASTSSPSTSTAP